MREANERKENTTKMRESLLCFIETMRGSEKRQITEREREERERERESSVTNKKMKRRKEKWRQLRGVKKKEQLTTKREKERESSINPGDVISLCFIKTMRKKRRTTEKKKREREREKKNITR